MKIPQATLDKMASNLENYLEILDRYIILEGITKEEYEASVKTIKKLIKKLRKGDVDSCIDMERYRELLESGRFNI